VCKDNGVVPGLLMQELGTTFFLQGEHAMNEPSAGPLAWVNGSDAPEKTEINLGFMALSDCARASPNPTA
jgi:hypothetical protein